MCLTLATSGHQAPRSLAPWLRSERKYPHPERSLTPERCRELVRGGQISAALGVESAAPRVLSLVDKGIPIGTVEEAIVALARAGVAVEAMCFSDFPSESYQIGRPIDEDGRLRSSR
jgi:hypothetical protein